MLCLLLTALMVVPCGSPAADRERPGSQSESARVIALVAPERGCTIDAGERIALIAISQQEVDIAVVTFLYDEKGVGADSEPPFEAVWDTTGVAGGQHTLKAVAYLAGGGKSESASVVVTVNAPTLAIRPAAARVDPGTSQGSAILREATPVLLRTTAELKSGRTPEGSGVTLEVARDVTASDGRILIAYGSQATGTVTRSRRRGMFGKSGKLEFSIDSAVAVDGTAVPLRAQELKATGKDKTDVVVATALLVSLLGVFIHGRDITVPPGTEVTAYVDRDTAIARPGKSVETPRGEPQETASIVSPLPGSTISGDDEPVVALDMSPRSKIVKVQLFVDGEMRAEQSKDDVTGVFRLKKLTPGEHSIRAEVGFSSGRIVRTDAVTLHVAGE